MKVAEPVVSLVLYRNSYLSVFISMFLLFSLSIYSNSDAAVIDFDDYPEGTIITDQYRELGVLFSSSPNSPYLLNVNWFFTSIDTLALIGSQVDHYGSGPITIQFVDPSDGTPIEVSNFSFYYYWVSRYMSESVTIIYYDIDENIVSQVVLDTENANPGFPPKVHKVHIVPGPANFFHIDDLTFCFDIDADGDGHYSLSSCLYPHDDCDDNDPTVPGTDGEVCGDGKDNDCDGYVDCLDWDCATDLVCFPRPCSASGGSPSSSIPE